MKHIIAFVLVFSFTASASPYKERVKRFKKADSADLADFEDNTLWRGTCVTNQFPYNIRSSAASVDVEEHPILGDRSFLTQVNLKQDTTHRHLFRLLRNLRLGGKWHPIEESTNHLVAYRERHKNRVLKGWLNRKDFYLRMDGDTFLLYVEEFRKKGGSMNTFCEFTDSHDMN